MKRPGIALADLMVFIALCALEITVVRWAVVEPSPDGSAEIALASPLFLAFGFSTYRALRQRERRAFWIVFGTSAGLAGLVVFALVWLHAPPNDWYANSIVEPAIRAAREALGLSAPRFTSDDYRELDFWGLDVPLILAFFNVPFFVPALSLGWLVQRYRMRLTIGRREPPGAGVAAP